MTDIEELMEIRRTESPKFRPISYHANVEDNSIFNKSNLLEGLAEDIGSNLTNSEFGHFIFELKKIPCKTVKTKLENVVETLEQTHDELIDLGFGVEQLFMPLVLKSEIRKRKQSKGVGIKFSHHTLKPILAKKLGHSQIIFSNKHCFAKTYPKTIDEQILVSVRRGIRKSKITCQIIQNLHFLNLESMRRIVVTDSEKSDFLNPDN